MALAFCGKFLFLDPADVMMDDELVLVVALLGEASDVR
jgi:hypothetical protein